MILWAIAKTSSRNSPDCRQESVHDLDNTVDCAENVNVTAEPFASNIERFPEWFSLDPVPKCSIFMENCHDKFVGVWKHQDCGRLTEPLF